MPATDPPKASATNDQEAEPQLLEEKFSPENDDDDDRPELAIAPRDRKLITQPFDFIVSSLEQQIREGALLLQDEFQRRRVWDDPKSSRLIESLLLNVPIPVCYFAELEDGAYSVIDGQQRLTAIYRFLTNQFALRGLRVRPELNRKRFVELESGDQRLIRTRTIRCIAIQKESHPDIRFDVFERLNSGAVRLNPQELRNSTSRGKLNKLIKALCEDKAFQEVRNTTGVDKRMGDAELILRFFAFHFGAAQYKGYFAPFLDKYLQSGVNMTEAEIELHKRTFLETVAKAKAVFGNQAFRRFDEEGNPENQINRAVYDVVMLTFARIDPAPLEQNREAIIGKLRDLSQHDEEFIDAISQATRDKKRINARVRRWIESIRELGIACPNITFGE